MEQGPSSQANIYSDSQEIPQPIMKTGGSLPCSQEPTEPLYSKPNESIPHFPMLFRQVPF